MMNKFLTQVALSALICTGVMVAPVMAQQEPPKPAATPGSINWNELNLTPVQVKKINEIRMAYSKLAIKQKADIQVKSLEIQQQLMSPAPNPSYVRKLLQEKLLMESKLQAASLENFLAIKKLLTPVQLAKLPQAMSIK